MRILRKLPRGRMPQFPDIGTWESTTLKQPVCSSGRVATPS